MGYDRGNSFPFDFKPNGTPFGSENRNENFRHDYIPFNGKGNGIRVFSVKLDSLARAPRMNYHARRRVIGIRLAPRTILKLFCPLLLKI